MTNDPKAIKQQSEKTILDFGGEILEWLPVLDISTPKTIDDIIKRASTINAMIQLHFGAPKYIIADWICENVGEDALTEIEYSILASKNEGLSDDENNYLYWEMESLWALVWAGELVDSISFKHEVGQELAGLSPNLQLNEGIEKYTNNMRLRPYWELFSALDLYYRLHWWQNNDYSQQKEMDLSFLCMVMARRKALEWIMDDRVDWDYVDMSV
ncbi:MAG: DUF4272 domain-containing protein [Candidatus Berkiella sp.]